MPRIPIADAESLLAELAGWVRIETPTTEPECVNALMDVATAELRAAGAAVERISGRGGYGDHAIARINQNSGEKPILVVGHLDTVWPSGTLATMPFRVYGDLCSRPRHFRHEGGQFRRLLRRSRNGAGRVFDTAWSYPAADLR